MQETRGNSTIAFLHGKTGLKGLLTAGAFYLL